MVIDNQPKTTHVPDRWAKFYEILLTVDPNDPEVQNYMSERPLNTNFELRSVLDTCDEDALEGK